MINITEYNNSQNLYYIAKIQAQACFYELFLNDIPVSSFGVIGGISSDVTLNTSILKSGNQVLKIRLKPMKNNLILSKQADFFIKILSFDLKENKKLDNEKLIFELKIPGKLDKENLPFFETEITFEANVNWDYSSVLEEAYDLRDKINFLNQSVENFYNIIKNKDSKRYFEIMKTTLEMQSKMEYMSEIEKKELFLENNLNYIKEVLPKEDYEINFYAKGKLVRFTSVKKDENDNQYLFKYTVPPLMEGKNDGEGAFNYLFFLPKEKSELEVF